MGFESYFILYRKYNTKASREEISKIVAKYVKVNKEHDYSETKKTDEEYAKDIPLILNPNYGSDSNVYDEDSGTWNDVTDHSIEGQRNEFKYVLSTDGSNLDELLHWDFCSDFNCLCEEFGLGHGNKNEVIIDRNTAEKMLQACNYLLSGKYSKEFEDILDNKWIKILAEENSGDSYWPYVYRNNIKNLENMTENERNSLEYVLKNVKYALETYLNSETSGQYGQNTELMLVYSISY